MKDYTYPITLGELLEKLEAVRDKTASITFDFCNLNPNKIESYRGYYCEGCLTYEDSQAIVTVEQLIAQLGRQLGTTMYGYKGGSYTITENINMYVAEDYGDWSQTAIVDVYDGGWFVKLVTTFID